MAENLWQAGGADNIFAPYEWSNGAPQPGDTLVIKSGTAYLADSGIYGDTVVLDSQRGSYANPQAGAATLVAYGNGTAVSVSVSQDPATFVTGGYASGVVEIVGAPQVSLQVDGDGKHGSPLGAATVNIDDYSQWRGGFENGGTLVINGTSTSTFANTASGTGGEFATINVDVVGTGTFEADYQSVLTFTRGVSSDQTVNDRGGVVNVDDPQDFHAAVTLSPVDQLGPANTIALAGLTADHSSFQDGVLSLISGGSDIYDLRLQTSTGDAVAVQTSRGIDIFASVPNVTEVSGGTVLPHV